MLVDNTCTFKHVYKGFQNGALNNILQPQNLAVTLFSKKINQSIGFPVVHTWKRAWTVFPLLLVSSSYNQNRGPPSLLTENVAKMAMEFPRNTGITFKLCIICQTQTDEELVEKPVSHNKLFHAIKERSHYGDVKFAKVRSFLKGFPFE